jgi:hypothetical protein
MHDDPPSGGLHATTKNEAGAAFPAHRRFQFFVGPQSYNAER